MDKTYTGTFLVGATRPSFDMETEIDLQYNIDHINKDMIEEARKSFVGDTMQMPPVYSAIKQDGKAVYKKAHKGQGDTVTMEARKVKISKFEISRIELPEVDFEIVCSKGTYVRSLAFDFGKALGSGAYLQSLHRAAIGEFRSEDAWPLDDLIKEIHSIEAPVVIS
jgi:tRNA pseudouridine55 synthase